MRNLILAACLCAAAAPALAQQLAAQPPSPEWVAAALRALAEQRNEAMDRTASLSADLDAARRELAVLKQGAAKARAGEVTPPPTLHRQSGDPDDRDDVRAGDDARPDTRGGMVGRSAGSRRCDQPRRHHRYAEPAPRPAGDARPRYAR